MDSKTVKFNDETFKIFKQRLKEENLPILMDDDAILMRFLRTRDYNIESAVYTARRCLKWREKYAEQLRIPFNDSCSFVVESEMGSILKNRDGFGRRIIYVKIGSWDPNRISIIETAVGFWYMVDLLTLEEDVQSKGIVVVLDGKGVGMVKMAHFISFITLDFLKMLFGFFQGGAPIRLKGAYYIRTPYILNTFYHAVKYLLKKKARGRIYFSSGGPNILHKHLGVDSFPDFSEGRDKLTDYIDKEFLKELYSRHNSCYESKHVKNG